MKKTLGTSQQAVLNYLRKRAGHPISPTQIGDELGLGMWGSAWASPICKRLVDLGLIKRTPKGWYFVEKGIKS
jgi:DNA-binding MarR family transcriptional regulator